MKTIIIPIGARLVECLIILSKGKFYLQALRDKGANLNPRREHDMYADKFRAKGAWVKFDPAYLDKLVAG